ncbi:pyruvate kinase, partial [Pseudomonas sp. 5S2]|nr:pyruvate kinase [Pseudomonas sp. 5S2]
DQAQRYQWIRQDERQINNPLGNLNDLQRPKLSDGRFDEGKVQLLRGQALRLHLEETLGDQRRVNLPHPEINAALEPRIDLLLDH